MCRNIKVLRREKPPLRIDEIYESSYNLARKVAGYQKPSKKNQPIIEKAASDITTYVVGLLETLEIGGKKPCVEILKS